MQRTFQNKIHTKKCLELCCQKFSCLLVDVFSGCPNSLAMNRVRVKWMNVDGSKEVQYIQFRETLKFKNSKYSKLDFYLVYSNPDSRRLVLVSIFAWPFLGFDVQYLQVSRSKTSKEQKTSNEECTFSKVLSSYFLMTCFGIFN